MLAEEFGDLFQNDLTVMASVPFEWLLRPVTRISNCSNQISKSSLIQCQFNYSRFTKY